MRNLIFIICLMIAIPAFSQSKAVDDLFRKYATKDGFVTVTVSKGVLDFLATADQDPDLKELAGSLTAIRILTRETKNEGGTALDFYKELVPKISAKEYTELVHIRSAEQNLVILVKENKGIIKDLLLVAGGDDNALISIQGNFDLKKINKLSKSMPGNGMQHLDKLNQ